MAPTLYILYNATSSVLGKLQYSYRHITAPAEQPACAACDITNGGLKMGDCAPWKEAKTSLTNNGLTVHQYHKDELPANVKTFMQEQKLRYPIVLLGDDKGELKPVMDNQELAACSGKADVMVEKLKEKGVLSGVEATAKLS